MNSQRKAGLFPYIFFAAAAALVAGAVVLTPALLSRFSPDGAITDYGEFYLRAFRQTLAAAGAMFAIAAFSALRPARAAGEAEPAGKNSPALFAVSFLILFLELALIRWIPAYVKLMSYFNNFIMLACFLGMGLGCLAAGSKRNYIHWTPYLLAGIAVAALLVYSLGHLNVISYSMNQFYRSETVYNDTPFARAPAQALTIGINIIVALMFILTTLAFIGPGQALGRLFDAHDNPVKAYMVNIGASIAGIACLSLLSIVSAPAWTWFAAAFALLAWLLKRAAPANAGPKIAIMAATLALIFAVNLPGKLGVTTWSPYYKIFSTSHCIAVNEIDHQCMRDTNQGMLIYHLAHMLNSDAETGRSFDDVLVIGAGSGNDVSHALMYGAKTVDAVEIDPEIIKIGRRKHPNRPYDNPAVHIINDDGRSHLRSTDKKYDLIVYGILDSVTHMGGLSSMRLESYLYTVDAFRDVRERLKPGGVFVAYGFFGAGWLSVRIQKTMEDAFGQKPVLVVDPPKDLLGGEEMDQAMLVFMVGGVEKIHKAFDDYGAYYISAVGPTHDAGVNGFRPPSVENLKPLYRADIPESATSRLPTDNWPFIYLKNPVVPSHNIWGLCMMAVVALVMVGAFLGFGGLPKISIHYLFLGGAFMLLESESIVKLSLIYGTTWFVNSVAFVGVLVMILLANLFVLRARPVASPIVFALLFAALLANFLLPLNVFLGKGWLMENLLSNILLFLPLCFAGVIFANSFRRSQRPALDLGSNLLGVIAEYSSLAYGYNALLIFAALMYAVSFVSLPKS